MQILLIYTFIIGLDPEQIMIMKIDDWNNIHELCYKHTQINIPRNKYLDAHVNLLKSQCDTLLNQIKTEHLYNTLNLVLIMNGIEATVNKEMLKLCFGRIHYLRHGRIKSVREFLKQFFNCDTHIDLLIKLQLVDSVHYTTMLRN